MAPKIPGTNCITKAEDALVAFIANLSKFQVFTGVGDAVSASERIYCHDVPQTAQDAEDTWSDAEWIALFPACLIRHPVDGQPFVASQVARDRYIRFLTEYVFAVTFEAYAIPGMDAQDQARYFMNFVGDIAEEMTEVSNGNPGEFGPTAVIQDGVLYRRPYAKMESLGDVFGLTFLLERRFSE